MSHRLSEPSIVLSADTVGVLGDLVLEKPRDRDHARQMLQLLSGETHTVVTAYSLFWPGRDTLTEAVSTMVRFRVLDPVEIERYLDEEVYLDKAAAYAIQGKASIFVEQIVGDFFNVVGLPITAVYQNLWTRLSYEGPEIVAQNPQ